MGRRWTRMLLSALLAGWLMASAHGVSAASPREMTATERWVAQQVAAGLPADLSVAPISREIRADFVSNLVRNLIAEAPLTSKGVLVTNAFVTGQLDIRFSEVTHPILLSGCEFVDSVVLLGAQFRNAVSFDGSIFDQDAIFNSAYFDGPLILNHTVFRRGVDLVSAEIAGQLEVLGAQLSGNSSFDYLKVGGAFHMQETSVRDTLKVAGATFGGDVEIHGAAPSPGAKGGSKSPIQSIDLSDSTVSGDLTIWDVSFGSFTASGLRVSALADLSYVSFKSGLDLSRATFSVLKVGDAVDLPPSQDRVHITGMTFQSVVGSWQPLRRLIGGAQYDSSAYDQLQLELQKRGDFAGGDDVLWEHQTRERQRLMRGGVGQLPRWSMNLAQGYLSNYGRDPYRPLAIAAIVILIGGLVFRPRFMKAVTDADVTKGTDNHPAQYNAFEYSLGLFIPAFHLGMAKRWEPKTLVVKILSYIHQGLGWTIAAVALAMYSGLIPKA